jgi:hypothetical protein
MAEPYDGTSDTSVGNELEAQGRRWNAEPGEQNEEGQLNEPFDITLEPPTMETTNHPGQDLALRAAVLTTTIDETHDFDSQRVHVRQLDRMRMQYEAVISKEYFPDISKRTKMSWRNSRNVSTPSAKDINWRADKFFLDLLICRGRDIGLSAMLPNINIQHTFEFKIESKWSPRTFSAKYAHLGFDPCGAMQYFGRTPCSEDAWIAWIPIEYLGDNLYEEDPIAPGTSSGNTHITKRHFHVSFMFFAYILDQMGHRDVTVYEEYPDIDDHHAVEDATNFGCVPVDSFYHPGVADRKRSLCGGFSAR